MIQIRPKGTSRRTRTMVMAVAVGLLAGALASPAPAAAYQKGFWGPTTLNGASAFPIYKDLGVTLYQTTISWPSVAPTRPANPRDPADPAYRWPADVDFALQQAAAHNMRVLLLLQSSPPWANGGRAPGYAPRRPSDFADFARAAARRYPAVRHWMIWGEPHRIPLFMPFVAQKKLGQPLTARQKQAPHRYARLLDTTYAALKAERRSNLVIGGNTYTTGDIRPRRWIQNLRLPNGKPPRMDLYGHNPFSYRNPDLDNPQNDLEIIDFSDIQRFSRDVDRYLGRPGKRRIRIWLSEFAIPTDKPDLEFNFHVTRAVQAKWIRNGFGIVRRLESRIYGLGWIHLTDGAPNPNSAVIQSGLLTFDGQKKPGYYAFKRG